MNFAYITSTADFEQMAEAAIETIDLEPENSPRVYKSKRGRRWYYQSHWDKDLSFRKIGAPDENDDEAQSTSESQQWPEGCRYFSRKTMNASAIQDILVKRTQYHPVLQDDTLAIVNHSQDSTTCHYAGNSPSSVVKRLRPANSLANESDTPNATVLFVGQKRIYFQHGSVNWIKTSLDTWRTILIESEILPSFLSVLDTDDSACAHHITYANKAVQARNVVEPETLHLTLKVGDFVDNELALYARQELRTGHAFVMFVGQEKGCGAKALHRRMAGAGELNVFHIILTFLEIAHKNVDAKEWECDSMAQKVEARTGYASFKQPNTQVMPIGELSFSKELQVYANRMRLLIWACRRYAEILEFLQHQLVEFQSLTKASNGYELSTSDFEELKHAFEQMHSLFAGHAFQTEELLHRVEAQMNVTRALVAERDSSTTIEISRAAKRDSEVMRGIAIVTMVFLPATFAATFFSMVFFHVGDETSVRLTVDKRIWLYPTVTVPLTLLMGWLYLHWSFRSIIDKLGMWRVFIGEARFTRRLKRVPRPWPHRQESPSECGD